MNVKNDFLRFCGKLLFNPEDCGWDELSSEQKAEYCVLALKEVMQNLFARFLQERLPAEFYSMFCESYRCESFSCMIENRHLTELYHVLETEKIPFLPIKGADLAFRVYSDRTLRPHGDWDIMFHKEDCPRVIQLLQKQGWQSFSGCDLKEPGKMHHYERMHNEYQALEVHWTLPRFGSAVPEEIWEHTEKINEYHHVLTREMNLLLISAHAGVDEFTHMSDGRIVMDAGMILNSGPVDWDEVHRLSDRWGILHPDILFRVFRDFFPDGVLPAESLNPEQQKLICEIFEMRGIVRKYSPYENCLSKLETPDIQWLLKRLKFYSHSSICSKYHIRPHQYAKIIWYGLFVFFEKTFFILTHSRFDHPNLRNYYSKVADLEKLIKSRGRT